MAVTQPIERPAAEGLLAELRRELRPGRLALSLTAGLVVGVVVVIVAISVGALVFSGPLAAHTSQGIGLGLFTALVIGVVAALRSSFPGMVATPQESPAAILALIAVAVAGAMPATASEQEVFLTVMVAVASTTLATGLFFFALGMSQVGGLIRFIPYPVIGGFLAGTGWLLVKGFVRGDGRRLAVFLGDGGPDPTGAVDPLAARVSVRHRAFGGAAALPPFPDPPRNAGRVDRPLLPAAVCNRHLGRRASARGLLLGPFPEGGLWRPLSIHALTTADWGILFSQTGSLVAILVVGVVALLLNASGLELAVERDIDLDRELQIAGLANVLSGLGGGLVGFQTLSLSTLGHRMSRRAGWWV